MSVRLWRSILLCDRKEFLGSGHALELMLALVGELDAGADD